MLSRRSQVGSIEKSGKWYVVRFWKDVAGEEKRTHASDRICPISGEGSLSIGLGFELLPEMPIVRNVRRKSAREKVAVAA
jgi:hypothetical protein